MWRFSPQPGLRLVNYGCQTEPSFVSSSVTDSSLVRTHTHTHTRACCSLHVSFRGGKTLTHSSSSSSSSVLQVDVTYLACSKNTTSTCVLCGRPDQLLLGVLLPRAFILLINHLGYLRRRAQPPRTHTRASRGFVLRCRSCALPCCRVGRLQ